MKKGQFIVFEGMDGSGKSTAVQLMYEKLQEQDIPVQLVRIPGGTNVGEKLRSILLDGSSNLEPESEFLLMQATRIEAYKKVIKPAIDSGTWVICDRFCTSSYAYQYAAKGVSRSLISDLMGITTPASKIDCNIYIRRPFDDIISYLNVKDKDHFESMNTDKLRLIYNEYEFQATDVYDTWVTINNNGNLNDLQNKINETYKLLQTVGIDYAGTVL
jgi:dTMP kinase